MWCDQAAVSTLERYRSLNDDHLLLFFSGGKGYHVGVPLPHDPQPSPVFHLTARRLAKELAAAAGVKIDPQIYDRVRCFRAPNSRHPKTGLHKRSLTHAELFGLTASRITELAREPAPFDVPSVAGPVPEIETAWNDAVTSLKGERKGEAGRTHPAGGRLQRDTLEFIRNGAEEGERHTRLFRAAGNLREFDAPPTLVYALLTEAGLDSGLSPSEVTRQIRCGIEHTDRQRAVNESDEGGER